MARPICIHDNRLVRKWLLDNQEFSEATFSSPTGVRSGWLDDVLTGAGRLNGSPSDNTKPVSPHVIYPQLLTHDTITTKAVREFLSCKRIVSGESMVSERYARYVTACVVSASKSIEYYLGGNGALLRGTQDETALFSIIVE